MDTKARGGKSGPPAVSGTCACFDNRLSRREFIGHASCALWASLVAAGVLPEAALARPTAVRAVSVRGAELAYPLPASDGVNIDKDNEVILVRSANRVYAFALSCPHENTALRWRPRDNRFQCPLHESKYQPDGTFMSGRATRNMDRYALRREGGQVFVNLDGLFRSDRKKAEWDSAVIALD